MLGFSSFFEFLILRLGLQSQEMEIVGIISQHVEVGTLHRQKIEVINMRLQQGRKLCNIQLIILKIND